VGILDWLRRRPGQQAAPQAPAWHVYVDGADLVAEDNRGHVHRATLTGARNVRVVPLSGGNAHVVAQTRGWQVALARPDGDVLVGSASPDWREARDLARQVCDKTELPLDELTEKLFSRVGQYSPPPRPD
jgi:hypothetical protein